MSKYRDRQDYHYRAFKTPHDPYRLHVLDIEARVRDLVPTTEEILEVGAGEGLILRRLAEHGYTACGCDIDPYAVELAVQKGNHVIQSTIDAFEGRQFGAVLMLDVLEHVDDPAGTVRKAQEMAPAIIIAIPDRYDPHASNSIGPDDVTAMFDADEWELVDCVVRHARHVFVYRRWPAMATTPSLEDGSIIAPPRFDQDTDFVSR